MFFATIIGCILPLLGLKSINLSSEVQTSQSLLISITGFWIVHYRFSAFWLRSKCSICSYQLNI